MISKGIMKGGAITVGVGKVTSGKELGKEAEFTFEVKKGRKGSLMREEIINTDQLVA